MSHRLRLLSVLGFMILLVFILTGCNRERPPVTNDKGTPAPGRGTVAAVQGSPTSAAVETSTIEGAQPTTPTAPSPQTQPTTAPPQSGATGAGQTFNYTVVAGDNLAAIAARYGVTVDTLARLNGITDPNALTLGQVLKIPGAATTGGAAPTAATGGAPAGGETTYTVQPGDTLGKIAQRFGVTSTALATLNNLTNPDQIKVGQKLRVPAAGGTAPTTSGQSRTHIVAQGETLGTIAKRYGVTVKQIQDANAIANPDRIYVGQKLTIP